MVRYTSLDEALLRARTNGKDDGHLRCDCANGVEKFSELRGGIYVGRAMQGQDSEPAPIGAVLETQFLADAGILRCGEEMTQRVDHDIAHEVDVFTRPALLEQILDGVLFGDEEVVGQGARD